MSNLSELLMTSLSGQGLRECSTCKINGRNQHSTFFFFGFLSWSLPPASLSSLFSPLLYTNNPLPAPHPGMSCLPGSCYRWQRRCHWHMHVRACPKDTRPDMSGKNRVWAGLHFVHERVGVCILVLNTETTNGGKMWGEKTDFSFLSIKSLREAFNLLCGSVTTTSSSK